ncbi:response regulator transcription factor [Plastoroseomonas arctica]|uniref:Response regulator transcription factor n=1 Tax=Plastoroseomonas arctica TaxID=1509237 RepID=A0AAF1JZG4_9PROT|nr:response regulator transcription factor [Plastoroseomonas arctica]MBR0655748.1 response regulator transcription factor [Plastoroseomonas arctica]
MDQAVKLLRRPRLLIVDAEGPCLRDAVRALDAEGFAVAAAHDLATAWHRLSETPAPEALLLDASLAEAGLLATIRALGQQRPRLVLAVQTGAAQAEEEIILTELGADLYWAKPLAPRLAGARLRAALRRAAPGDTSPAPAGLPLGEGLQLEPESRAVRRADGTRIRLARSELALLRCLAKAGRGVARREDIAADVLGRIIAYGDRSVDNLVLGLRRKLGMDAEYGAIRAVRGVGYRLVAPDAAPSTRDQNRSVNPAFSR